MNPFRWNLGRADTEQLLAAAERVRGESTARAAWRRLRANRVALACLAFLGALIVAALLAPLWPLPSPIHLELSAEPSPPTAPWTEFVRHGFTREYWPLSWIDQRLVDARVALFGDLETASWLGTDAKGRDVLARIVWGSRTSLAAALAAAITSLVLGVGYGALSGLASARVDNVLMRIVDALQSLPFIFLVIFLVTLVDGRRSEIESGFGLERETIFFLAIGSVYWLTMARVVRGQVLALRHSEFLAATKVLGASLPRTLFAHVLPNILSVVIVYLTLTIPSIMLFESFLSFLGLGIEPPKVSWGLLAVDGAESLSPLFVPWWLVVFPSLAMATTLLALNLLGDALRDALDPKLALGVSTQEKGP